MSQSPADWRQRKLELRTQAHDNRRKQPDKGALSRSICRKLVELDEYARARTVMSYVDIRDEVRTQHLLATALEQGKRLVVPYCVGDQLKLFLVGDLEELAPDTLGIPEPKAELRGLADKSVEIGQVDLIVVPGVAFDATGGRIGHGGGYFDRLLCLAPPDTTFVAPAFECQIFPDVPMQSHDVFMHMVVTEKMIYRPDPEATRRKT